MPERSEEKIWGFCQSQSQLFGFVSMTNKILNTVRKGQHETLPSKLFPVFSLPTLPEAVWYLLTPLITLVHKKIPFMSHNGFNTLKQLVIKVIPYSISP